MIETHCGSIVTLCDWAAPVGRLATTIMSSPREAASRTTHR